MNSQEKEYVVYRTPDARYWLTGTKPHGNTDIPLIQTARAQSLKEDAVKAEAICQSYIYK